jgi:hypothetical protein
MQLDSALPHCIAVLGIVVRQAESVLQDKRMGLSLRLRLQRRQLLIGEHGG